MKRPGLEDGIGISGGIRVLTGRLLSTYQPPPMLASVMTLLGTVMTLLGTGVGAFKVMGVNVHLNCNNVNGGRRMMLHTTGALGSPLDIDGIGSPARLDANKP